MVVKLGFWRGLLIRPRKSSSWNKDMIFGYMMKNREILARKID